MKLEREASDMEEGRALLTEREREALATDESGSYRYKTRSYLRSRLDELERDAELLAEAEPELFDRLQAVVRFTDAAAGAPDATADVRADATAVAPSDVRDAVAGLNLPDAVDRGDAVAAIHAAHDYIRNHSGATKTDLVTNIMPDHPLGYDVDDALAKIDAGERFRGAWWRTIVKPGLEALDDVEKPPKGGSTWDYTG